MDTAKVAIVMPAYNAEKTLADTVADIPKDCYDWIIVGDDCSADDTIGKAKELGLEVHKTPQNLGYGGNQKLIYRVALEKGADIVVMLHPDNQYDARLVGSFVGFLKHGTCDVILGSRIRSRREALKGGMPMWKYISNRMLTILLNLTYGMNLGEYHSGFRAYTREVLDNVDFESNTNDFGFDAEFLAQSIRKGYRVATAPMPVRYFKEASSIRFWPSVRYGLVNLRVALLFLLSKLGFRFKLFAAKPAP